MGHPNLQKSHIICKFIHLPFYFCVCGSVTLVLKVDDLGTVPSTVPMSSMSKPAPLDPAQFSLSRHGHPVQNDEIFSVSKSLGGVTLTSCAAALQHSATASHISV